MAKKEVKLAFEQRLQRLQEIVVALEGGTRPLEECLTLYKEGMDHGQSCREQLAKARHEVEIYLENQARPFVLGDDVHDEEEADEHER